MHSKSKEDFFCGGGGWGGWGEREGGRGEGEGGTIAEIFSVKVSGNSYSASPMLTSTIILILTVW